MSVNHIYITMPHLEMPLRVALCIYEPHCMFQSTCAGTDRTLTAFYFLVCTQAPSCTQMHAGSFTAKQGGFHKRQVPFACWLGI